MLAAQHTNPDRLQANAGSAQLSPAKAAKELRSLAFSIQKSDIQLKLRTVSGPYTRSSFLLLCSQHDRGCVRFRRATDASRTWS